MDGHSAMAAMQDGRRSGRFPQNDTHGIEHVDRYPDSGAMRRLRAIYRVMRTSGYSRSLSDFGPFVRSQSASKPRDQT